MTDQGRRQHAKELLDHEYDWPAEYMFKFIVPEDKLEQVQQIFPVSHLYKRASKQGNYISVTVTLRMESSEEVLQVYEQAQKIEGLIAL